jgi:heme exporter protein D
MSIEFFPSTSVAWKREQPKQLRRASLSLPYMAVLTGVPLRLWRSYVLTHGAPDSWAWVGGTFLIGMAFLYLMVTIHLGNYTLRHWTWRAPAFALLEGGAEILMSLALTTFGLEPLGTERAELSDWLTTSIRTLTWRLVGITLFVLVLAVVVSIMRRVLLVADQRSSTAVRSQRASGDDARDSTPGKGDGE